MVASALACDRQPQSFLSAVRPGAESSQTAIMLLAGAVNLLRPAFSHSQRKKWGIADQVSHRLFPVPSRLPRSHSCCLPAFGNLGTLQRICSIDCTSIRQPATVDQSVRVCRFAEVSRNATFVVHHFRFVAYGWPVAWACVECAFSTQLMMHGTMQRLAIG